MSNKIELTIEVPDGLEWTDDLLGVARGGAESALAEVVALESVAADLRARGIEMTAAELLARKAGSAVGRKKAGPRGPQRPRLSAEQKEAIIAALRAGTKASQLATEYERSLGTIMNLKRKAGLTKPRG